MTQKHPFGDVLFLFSSLCRCHLLNFFIPKLFAYRHSIRQTYSRPCPPFLFPTTHPFPLSKPHHPTKIQKTLKTVLLFLIRDPVPFWSLDPGSGMDKKSGSGSGMNNPDHISKSLETIFGLKYVNSLMRIRDTGWKKIQIRDPWSGMKKTSC